MDVNDIIYGLQTITEPVLTEIITSPTLIRLKGINQAGPSQYLFPWKKISRFEHSVGVLLLLRIFKAPLEEQVAGLLHDLTHTAFSHVADFMFANKNHEFHELFHEQMVTESEIGEILKKYKISQKVIHPENYSLLENDMPDLCADRIDYALRDFMALQKDTESIKAKLTGLIVWKNQFVFKYALAAESFANDYLFMDKATWAHPREIAIYEIMAQALAHALGRGMLTQRDLFTDDHTVMTILRTKGDPYIRKKIAYLTPKFRIEQARPEHYHLKVKTKIRYVDPKILVKNKLVRLSEISKAFKSRLNKHIEQGKKGWYLFIYPE